MSNSISSKCPECGSINKSGKLSCCARGGAWFKKCGDAGNTNFDHTWAEGIEACKAFENSILVEPPPQVKLGRVGVIAYPLNTTQLPKITHEREIIWPPDSMFTVDSTDFADCVGLAKVAVCIALFFYYYVLSGVTRLFGRTY